MEKIFLVLKQYIFLTIAVAVIAVGGATYFVVQMTSQGTELNDTSTQIKDNEEDVDQTGWIYVDGGAGLLENVSKYDYYSYIGESARGTEAYLASGGVKSTYEFSSEKAGTYKLQVSLSDDAEHSAGARNASVAVNGTENILKYINTPENTNGWKWFTLGNLSLKEGNNTISFSKDETTSAAYVMDQFRLVPVIASE